MSKQRKADTIPRSLHLSGHWKSGGILTIAYADGTKTVPLRSVKWSILAGLIKSAQLAAESNTSAFVSSKQLLDALSYYINRFDIPTKVYQSISELRQVVGGATIESVEPLGYRITIPVDMLHLEFRDQQNFTTWDIAAKVIKEDARQ